jgi:AAA+ ATPase superfamily predicted ATPase
MEFIDRQDELALLEDHVERPGASMIVVFGRRRIGKTALLQRLIEHREDAAYHVATQSTITEEMRRLSAELVRSWSLPLLEAQPLASTSALLALLQGLDQRLVLVLDELPYLLEADPSLPGKLQAAWDAHLSRSQLKLILCGSSIGMMQDTFLSQRSPLFGRRTGQLRLQALRPSHLAEAFDWSTPEIIELAALLGGVPGYLQRLDPAIGLAENLASRLLLKGEPMYEEIPFLLREELRQPRVYQSILAAIAAGARKYGEISSKTGLDRASLSRYLSILIDLGLVEREVPVTEPHPDKSRKGLYRICDPFVATWFRFVHPNRDRLERGLVDQVMATEVRPRLHQYLSFAVEPVICELFRSSKLAGLVPFSPAFSGRHWSPTAELDVVLLDAERRKALIGEIKWSRRVPVSQLEHLRRRAAAEPALAGLERTCVLISRDGFSGQPAPEDARHLIDLSLLRL